MISYIITPILTKQPLNTTITNTQTNTFPKTGNITFYADQNYLGSSYGCNSGQCLFSGTGLNNNVSSIKVKPGYKVQVFDKDDCTGNTFTYTSDIASLSGTGINNDIACAKVSTVNTTPTTSTLITTTTTTTPIITSSTTTSTTPTGNASLSTIINNVMFYKDQNFSGTSYGCNTGKCLFNGTGLKNEVSSIKVKPGYKVQVYDQDDCTGNTYTYNSDIASLTGTGINNDIACAIISQLPNTKINTTTKTNTTTQVSTTPISTQISTSPILSTQVPIINATIKENTLISTSLVLKE
jgi:hypothetical protein